MGGRPLVSGLKLQLTVVKAVEGRNAASFVRSRDFGRRVANAPSGPRRRANRQVRVASGRSSRVDELLAAVDIVGCSGDGCVRHEMDGEGGDVGRADHAAGSAEWCAVARVAHPTDRRAGLLKAEYRRSRRR